MYPLNINSLLRDLVVMDRWILAALLTTVFRALPGPSVFFGTSYYLLLFICVNFLLLISEFFLRRSILLKLSSSSLKPLKLYIDSFIIDILPALPLLLLTVILRGAAFVFLWNPGKSEFSESYSLLGESELYFIFLPNFNSIWKLKYYIFVNL